MQFKNYILLSFIICSVGVFAQPKVKLDTFTRGYSSPIGIENDGFTSRVFVIQQNGIIWTLDSLANKLDTFIDLRNKVQNNGEEGLLGVAFHPNYQQNGYFYTYYTKKNTTDNAVFRYKVSSNPNKANIDSELLVINLVHPTFTNHNGGCIRFGIDGFLYIATGDGGSGGDPNNNSQNKNSLQGKLLRISVNNFSVAYTIPATNPFVGQANIKPEIWAYGLRNPWRFSFDRETNDLWLADVGQGANEETNFQPANSIGGENYGWRCYEGNATFNTNGCLGASNYKFPFYTYGHNGTTGGFSITGGFIYRGSKYADLRGYYMFVDYISGNFWLTKKTDAIFTTVQQTSPRQGNISSFGQDIRGELYATNLNNGVIYKIRELCSPFQISLVNKKNPSCPNVANGSIEFTSIGSNGNVTYNWTNSNATINKISNLAPNKYFVTATDAIGCIRKDSVVLINQDTLRILLNSQNPSCPNVTNGQISVQAFDGIGSISYSWNNSGNTGTINNLAPNKYVVTVTDSVGCFAKDSVVLFNADTLDKPIIIQSNDTLFTANGFASYQWKLNEIDIADANQASYKFISGENYRVEITDLNGCKAISDSSTYLLTSLKNKNSNIEKFSLFPNPSNDNLIIDIGFNANKKSTLKIINTVGQVVYTEQIQGIDFTKNISLQQFAKGLYQLAIFTEDGKLFTKTFVKE